MMSGGQRVGRQNGGDVISYGVEQAADVTAEKIELEKSGVSYILKSKEGKPRSICDSRVISTC